MKLKEFEGKRLFEKVAIPIRNSKLISSISEIDKEIVFDFSTSVLLWI